MDLLPRTVLAIAVRAIRTTITLTAAVSMATTVMVGATAAGPFAKAVTTVRAVSAPPGGRGCLYTRQKCISRIMSYRIIDHAVELHIPNLSVKEPIKLSHFHHVLLLFLNLTCIPRSSCRISYRRLGFMLPRPWLSEQAGRKDRRWHANHTEPCGRARGAACYTKTS